MHNDPKKRKGGWLLPLLGVEGKRKRNDDDATTPAAATMKITREGLY